MKDKNSCSKTKMFAFDPEALMRMGAEEACAGEVHADEHGKPVSCMEREL